jgi:hypothetical protein
VKISHEDRSVVKEILMKLNAQSGKETPLTITRGKIHEYLGKKIDFTEDLRVKFWMDNYLD